MTQTREESAYLKMLNSLLYTPHRNVGELKKIHQEVLEKAPVFYGHAATWYQKNGEIRDSQEMYVASLLLSEMPEHREAGFALLQDFAPYEVERIFKMAKGFVDFRWGDPAARHKPRKRPKDNPYLLRFGGTISIEKRAERKVRGKVKAMELIKEEVGPFRTLPRSAISAGEHYLRNLESNHNRFDNAALRSPESLKYLYATLGVKPDSRAQEILFDDNPPKDSRVYAKKLLTRAASVEGKAKLIVDNKIPYTVCVGALQKKDFEHSVILAAIIHVMSPQELLGNVDSLKKRGVLENEDLKKLVGAKLKEAATDKRVGAYKAQTVTKKVSVDEQTAEMLEKVTETQVKSKGTIKDDVLLLGDKSGSLSVAIEISAETAAMIAAITEGRLSFWLMDEFAYEMKPKGTSLKDYQNEVKKYKADGATSLGVGLYEVLKRKESYARIILVTDEDENREPRFVRTYKEYSGTIGIAPNVIIVKVGAAVTKIETELRNENIPFDTFDMTKADRTALPQLIPFLTKPTQLDLLREIMATPLPTRNK